MPPVLIFMLPPLIAASFVGYLALRLVRAFERRSVASQSVAELTARIESLEHTLEEQTEHLRRVTEGQDFTERLLSNRTAATQEPRA